MKHIYALIAILLLTSACEEDINISCGNEASRLVIDGHICDIETEWNYVRLTMSNDYFSNSISPAVSGASVTINDGSNVFTFVEGEKKGYYNAPEGFIGEHGKTYVLTVIADTDNDGKTETYTASEPMPPTYGLDSVVCIKSIIPDYYQIELYAEEDVTMKNFYMFGLAYKDELLNKSFTSFESTDDELFSSEYCWGASVFMFSQKAVNNYTLTPGDEMTLYCLSINEEFYKYDQAVDDIQEGGNPMFSSAPANAVGNIKGGAYGFFTVFAVVSAKCTLPE